jgi:hypothetical protein
MNRARSKSLLLSAALALLLCLALFVRAGLDLAAPGPEGTGPLGSPAAGLILASAAFLAVLWTFFLAKGMAAAPVSDDSRAEARPAPAPGPAIQAAPPPRPAPVAMGAKDGMAAEEPGAEALMLLSLLQEKGRFVDFVMEDIAGYSNEQVGAVARVVHQGCRTVVQEAFSPLPVAPAENARITLEPGYDAEEFRLVGRAEGGPPFTVKVTHKGWRARHVKLPRRMGSGKGAATGASPAAANPVIVPAEVTV